MSYEKQETDPKTIRLFYGIDEIFKKAQRKSSYKAASIKKEDGSADFIRVELSSDAKDLMKDYMEEGMLIVFQDLFSILSGESISHDVQFTPTGGTATQVTYADIADNENYRTINLDLIDKKIENAVVDFVLFRWYALKGIDDEAKIHNSEFLANKKDVSNLSLALRQL
nr:hypothetical protein [uncultured Draconibacterium sp.]